MIIQSKERKKAFKTDKQKAYEWEKALYAFMEEFAKLDLAHAPRYWVMEESYQEMKEAVKKFRIEWYG